MLFMMQVSFPLEKFNRAMAEGTAGLKLKRILEDIKPEAVYFAAKEGKRGGFILVNVEKSPDFPKMAEPWFLNFDAQVEFTPVMTPEDLQKSGLDEMAKKWK